MIQRKQIPKIKYPYQKWQLMHLSHHQKQFHILNELIKKWISAELGEQWHERWKTIVQLTLVLGINTKFYPVVRLPNSDKVDSSFTLLFTILIIESWSNIKMHMNLIRQIQRLILRFGRYKMLLSCCKNDVTTLLTITLKTSVVGDFTENFTVFNLVISIRSSRNFRLRSKKFEMD